MVEQAPNPEKRRHVVIVIPGLTGLYSPLMYTAPAIKHWQQHGLEPQVFDFKWEDHSETFEEKLQILLNTIDAFHQDGCEVSLVGCSAGGAAALVALRNRKDVLKHVATVCARLEKDDPPDFWWWRNWERRAKGTPVYSEAIQRAHRVNLSLTSDELALLGTFSAILDESVPKYTAQREGAQNFTVPMIEHVASIIYTLRAYPRLLQFLLSEPQPEAGG